MLAKRAYTLTIQRARLEGASVSSGDGGWGRVRAGDGEGIGPNLKKRAMENPRDGVSGRNPGNDESCM